ncbi:hypothetical protein MMC26_001710 [Xylographa opegraphella]|nr:hypothetical protein [Xylographa opegraphella]
MEYYPQSVEEIRDREYPLLKGITYLDHAGTTLYPRSLIRDFGMDMMSNVFGNPHSASPSSELSTRRVDRVRLRVLQFFRADPEDFDIVFVANATAAIRLVATAFQDYAHASNQAGFWYGYHDDAHTSLVGVRRLAAAGSRRFESDTEVEDWLAGRKDKDLMKDRDDNDPTGTCGLFAYPAQSNLNGRRLPLNWSNQLRKSLDPAHKNVYTLLDAAAYVCTAQLDLSDAHSAPDFTALSFYKIFGFPDLGALIVRKAAAHMLQRRRYFGGGTVAMVINQHDAWHAMKDHSLHEQLEDGTLPFHSLIALDSALDVHERLYKSMDTISLHTKDLALALYTHLSSLHHPNGQAVCVIYKSARSKYGDSATQGPTIAFNIRTSHGGWVGKSHVEKMAIARGIHLRTGGVCNPGGIASSLHLSAAELRRNYTEGMRCGDDLDILFGKPTGVVRVSLGAMSSWKDIKAFSDFVEETFVERPTPGGQSVTVVSARDGSRKRFPAAALKKLRGLLAAKMLRPLKDV